jgi:hypothetical protein
LRGGATARLDAATTLRMAACGAAPSWRCCGTGFVPVVSDAAAAAVPPTRRGKRRSESSSRAAMLKVAIEIEVGGAVVRVRRGTDARTVGAVLEAFEARPVIAPPAGVRVFVATRPVDFRKGMDGLASRRLARAVRV